MVVNVPALAVKSAVCRPAPSSTEPGAMRAILLPEMTTYVAPVAGDAKRTVHVAVPPAESVLGVQVSELTVFDGVRLTVVP